MTTILLSKFPDPFISVSQFLRTKTHSSCQRASRTAGSIGASRLQITFNHLTGSSSVQVLATSVSAPSLRKLWLMTLRRGKTLHWQSRLFSCAFCVLARLSRRPSWPSSSPMEPSMMGTRLLHKSYRSRPCCLGLSSAARRMEES